MLSPTVSQCWAEIWGTLHHLLKIQVLEGWSQFQTLTGSRLNKSNLTINTVNLSQSLKVRICYLLWTGSVSALQEWKLQTSSSKHYSSCGKKYTHTKTEIKRKRETPSSCLLLFCPLNWGWRAFFFFFFFCNLLNGFIFHAVVKIYQTADAVYHVKHKQKMCPRPRCSWSKLLLLKWVTKRLNCCEH